MAGTDLDSIVLRKSVASKANKFRDEQRRTGKEEREDTIDDRTRMQLHRVLTVITVGANETNESSPITRIRY